MRKISRKAFLKTSGIGLIAGPFILNGLTKSAARSVLAGAQTPFDCVLVPAQTGGPFYLDPEFDRSDIRESLPGLPMTLRFKVLSVKNCLPIPNAVVNIWHCDHRGTYSNFSTVYNNPFDASKDTWLRGYQTTDENGECTFLTVFPGWYTGRATHIHFDIHLDFIPGGPVNKKADSSSVFKSQMYIPDALRAKVYKEIDTYAKGDNPKNNADDLILKGADGLLLQFDESDYPNTLTANFSVALDVAGVAEEYIDPQGKAYFELEQNSPNPFSETTEIHFQLKSPGEVTLSVYNQKYELLEQLLSRHFEAGDYQVSFDPKKGSSALAPGVYQLHMVLENEAGRFRQKRKMQLE
ncbi:MAG: hypothetical protein KDC34_01030 [Saprospiraceae bacterium]|nr:hypothetical protein [Saprospiraceae bacterium]